MVGTPLPEQAGQSRPAYRIVFDEVRGRTTFSPAVRGVQGLVNRSASRLLEQLGKDGPFAQATRPSDEAFLSAATRNGWLTTSGAVNGSYRKVSAPDPVLQRAQIELSLQCNLSCSYCYSESGPTQAPQMSVEDLVPLLDDLEAGGTTSVDFTGGEYFLYRGWDELLSHARTLGLVVTVHTNGLLLTAKNVERLLSEGVRLVQVSADSSDPGLHDSIRGVKGAHSRMVAGIRRAVEAGLPVRVVLMAHRDNRETVLKSMQWFRDELHVRIAVDRVMATGGALHSPVALSAKEFYELVSPALGSSRTIAQTCGVEARQGGVAPECGIAHSFMYITADGHYSLCPTMTHREEARFTGPTVKDIGPTEAWRNDRLFRDYRYLNCRNASDRSCPAASACGGGCRSNAYLETGDLAAPDVVACNVRKNETTAFIDFRDLYARL